MAHRVGHAKETLSSSKPTMANRTRRVMNADVMELCSPDEVKATTSLG
jgi:hypothetical protein